MDNTGFSSPLPSQTHITLPNNQKSKYAIWIALTLVLASMTGVLGYYIGGFDKETIPNVEETTSATPLESNDLEESSEVVSQSNESIFPKHYELSLVSHTMGETRDYRYSFDYPSDWDIKIQSNNHKEDNLVEGCEDYLLLSPTGANIEIKLVCSSWSGKTVPMPEKFEVVTDLGQVGNDASNAYIIRYLDISSNAYYYNYVLVNPGENIKTKTQAQNELLVSYAPDDHYFIPSLVAVTTTSTNELATADQIVKSLTLTRK